jgi:enoyl-CoA hydratase/carnithine racemase
MAGALPPGSELPSPTPRLLGRVEGSIGWLVFNNPERHNALSRDMWEGIPPLLAALNDTGSVRVILLRGAGEEAFVSGADISEFDAERATPEAVERYDAMVERACAALAESPAPTLAMIRGHCLGGGLALAIACDLRLAAEDASFAIPAARLGIGYRRPAVAALIALIGPASAKEILFTARRLDAREAYAMGLVNRVVPVGELEAETRRTAKTIAGNAPLTIQAAKRAIAALRSGDPQAVAEAESAIARCFDSADYAEGRRAFLEKRRPRFTGR